MDFLRFQRWILKLFQQKWPAVNPKNYLPFVSGNLSKILKANLHRSLPVSPGLKKYLSKVGISDDAITEVYSRLRSCYAGSVATRKINGLEGKPSIVDFMLELEENKKQKEVQKEKISEEENYIQAERKMIRKPIIRPPHFSENHKEEAQSISKVEEEKRRKEKKREDNYRHQS